jgi:hypothetical protein
MAKKMPFGWRGDLVNEHAARLKQEQATREAEPPPVLPPSGSLVLHDIAKKVLGHYLHGPRPAAQRAIDLLQCVQIEAAAALTFTPVSHAFLAASARIWAGRPDDPTASALAWAAANTGAVPAADAGDDSDDLAITWARDGIPLALRQVGLQHRVQRVRSATTFDDLRDALLRKHPVLSGTPAVTADVPSLTRDADGVCSLASTGGRVVCFTGYSADLNGRGAAVLVDTSWGPPEPDGPLGSISIPSYSFWVLQEDATNRIAAGDTWIFNGFDGWPSPGVSSA